MDFGDGGSTPSRRVVGAVYEKLPSHVAWQSIMCRMDKSKYVIEPIRSPEFMSSLLLSSALTLASFSAVRRSWSRTMVVPPMVNRRLLYGFQDGRLSTLTT